MTLQQEKTEQDYQDYDELRAVLKRMNNRAAAQEDRWIYHAGYQEVPAHLRPDAETMRELSPCYRWYSMSAGGWIVSLVPEDGVRKIELYVQDAEQDEMLLIARTHKDNIPGDDLLTLFRTVQQIAIPDPNATKKDFFSRYCYEGDHLSPEELEAEYEAWERMQAGAKKNEGDIPF